MKGFNPISYKPPVSFFFVIKKQKSYFTCNDYGLQLFVWFVEEVANGRKTKSTVTQ